MTGVEYITNCVLNEEPIRSLPAGQERTHLINATFNESFRVGLGLIDLREIPVPGKVSLIPQGLSLAPEDQPTLIECLREQPRLIEPPITVKE